MNTSCSQRRHSHRFGPLRHRARSDLRPVLAALSFLPMMAATSAMAEDAPTGEQPAASPSGDIVVTARRKDESLSTVPVAVTAFSQQALTQRAIANVFDLDKAVPGLTVQANNGSTALPAFSIRGRGQNYGAASGSVETYFADIPLSPPFQEATLPAQFFDLQSFQVLKGPQGTLFGRNTTGGAVVIVPAAPTDKFEGYVRGQLGNYNSRQLEGAINIPLVAGKASLRLAAFNWQRDGYMTTTGGGINAQTGKTLPAQDFQNQNTTEFRATLRVTPNDAIENTTLFTYHYDKVRVSLSPGLNIGDFYNQQLPGTTQVATEARSGLPVYTSPYSGTYRAALSTDLNHPGNHAWALINTTKIKLGESITLKNIAGYIEAHAYSSAATDYDGTNLAYNDVGLPPRRNINRQFTDEVQLQGRALGDRLDWTVGGLIDLTREPGGATMNFQDYSDSYGARTTIFEQNTFSSRSLFVAGTYKLTERLNLSGGFRHTWDSIALAYQVSGNADTPVHWTSYADPASINRTRSNFSGSTFNISADWHPAARTMIYGGFRRGYKRGGFIPALGTKFGAETVDDVNLGWKQDFVTASGMRGRIAIEGFYDFYRNMQVSYISYDPNASFISITTNVPRTTFRGFELDGSLDPTSWARISGAFSFVDAKNKRWIDPTDPTGTHDLSGNPVPFVSKYKLSATLRLHHELADGLGEIALAPSINHQSQFFSSPTGRTLPVATQQALGLTSDFDQISVGGATVPAYTTGDLRVEWNRIARSPISAAVTVTNITDKWYILSANNSLYAGNGSWTVAPPRMITGELTFRF